MLFVVPGMMLMRGAPGLSFLIPASLHHTPIIYGQGEGEIAAGGVELGIYQAEGQAFLIVGFDMNSPECIAAATKVVEEICRHWEVITLQPFRFEVEC